MSYREIESIVYVDENNAYFCWVLSEVVLFTLFAHLESHFVFPHQALEVLSKIEFVIII